MGVLVEKGLMIEKEIKTKQNCNEEVEGLKRQKETIYGLAKKISDKVNARNHIIM